MNRGINAESFKKFWTLMLQFCLTRTHRRRLVNSFVNSIYLYDDKIIIDCNYKEGTETITLEEIENSALGSDLTSVGAPIRVFLLNFKSFV